MSRYLQNKAATRGAGQVKDLSKSTQQPNRSLPALSTRPNTEDTSPLTAYQSTEIDNARFEEVVGKMSVPQELQEMIEAEICRAAEAKANIQIFTTAINAVEDSLSPMLTGGNKSFLDSPGLSPGFNSAIPSTSTLSQKQKTSALNNGVKKSIPKDDRLFDRIFLRIPRNHEWRSFTPAGIREAVIRKLDCSPTTIDRIIPVTSGYAIVAKDETGRQLLLSLSHRLPEDILLEAARDWVSYMLPNIPTHIVTIEGRKPVAESEVIAELERVTGLTPKSVRYRGKSKVGAPYRTWMVFFDKDSAPKPGFRLFDDSGRATPLKPVCKRRFYSTGCCSRAPACGRCGSIMHPEEECKALTKCRNCGGPHRSDSRKCLARPTKAGKPTKEQLQVIRIAGQREFDAVNRARAAVDRAKAACISVSSTPASNPEAQAGIIPASVELTIATPQQCRGGITNDIALSRAYEIGIDVALIQEPCSSSRTKSHPEFDCHMPYGGPDVRPRAVIYTRKNEKEINAVQIFSCST
ncbi:putative eka-like protein [Erysiphe necator]|uniref:Putative eka-like protein n=1 Tax=Uncinula necator TaxID=52586 RepID=A0A0B1P819_UNCNE|nr:putative eka-like protein [Erysiphe necator]